MIGINRNPSHRELLFFGLLLGLFTVLVGALAYLQWDAPAAASKIWIAGGSLTVLHFVIPPLRRFFYLTWMYSAFPIGWAVSHTMLAILYYCILTPIGLIMRLMGYDPMSRRLRSEHHTYWEKYSPEDNPKRYFRQF